MVTMMLLTDDEPDQDETLFLVHLFTIHHTILDPQILIIVIIINIMCKSWVEFLFISIGKSQKAKGKEKKKENLLRNERDEDWTSFNSNLIIEFFLCLTNFQTLLTLSLFNSAIDEFQPSTSTSKLISSIYDNHH